MGSARYDRLGNHRRGVTAGTGPFWPLDRLNPEDKFGAKASKPGLTILQREGETSLGLQPADERLSHRGGRGPESSADRIARDVARQTDAALGNHLGRRTIAGILVTLDRGPQAAAIAGLADKQDVVEAGVAGGLGWALAGLRQEKTTDQGAGRRESNQGVLERLAAGQRFGTALARRAGAGHHHLVIDEIPTIGVVQQLVRTMHRAGSPQRST